MFQRKHRWVLIGLIILSGMFLAGQEPWPTCMDLDGDGYGDPASDACTYSALDCDDSREKVFPGAPELCDQVDNQCPGDTGYGETDEGCAGMARIPAGCFDMGDHFNEGFYDSRPVHSVCLSAYEMDAHEVTNAEYRPCVDAGACNPPFQTDSRTRSDYFNNPAYDNYPVIWVTQVEAKQYCSWVGKRLPTEAEWEYAARGGLAGKRYPWGDALEGHRANYWDSGDAEDNDTNAVGSYPPNGYGLYDMSGNVWEWTNDWYDPNYYSISPGTDPQGPDGGIMVVLRGGSLYYNCPLTVTVGYRHPRVPDGYLRPHTGFRCAR